MKKGGFVISMGHKREIIDFGVCVDERTGKRSFKYSFQCTECPCFGKDRMVNNFTGDLESTMKRLKDSSCNGERR